MDLSCGGVGVVVFWSVEVSSSVDEGMCFCACSEGVEVGDVEDFEFCHEGLGVGSGWQVFNESDDLFLGSDERLDVGFPGV